MNQRLSQAARVAIVAAALLARLLPGPRTIDDAFITYRYARNLLSGNGFVFNPGEYVLGTTTPLYTLLLTVFGSLSGGGQADLITLALLLNAAAGAIACVLIMAIGRQLGHPLAGLGAAAVWSVAPMGVTFAIGGMETSLFIALILATYYFHLAGSRVVLGITAAALLLTRPDGLLFLAPVALDQIRQIVARRAELGWRELTAAASAFALPLAAWSAFAAAYFGSPIPHSITAKVAAYRLPAEAGLVRLLQHYATPFLGHLTFGTAWIAVGLILFPVLFLLGTLRLVRSRPETWPLAAAPWIYLVAYAIANPLIFRWYLAPPLPIYFLGIFIGLQRVGNDMKFPSLLPLTTAAALLMSVNGWALHPDHGPDRPAPEMAYIELELLYERAGRELREEVTEDQMIAAGDVGALAYYSEARILDTLGIISPQSTAFYPADPDLYVINYAIPPELVLELTPDYLVILEVYGRRGLLQNSHFQAHYDLIESLETDIYGSEGMLVFSRVSGD